MKTGLYQNQEIVQKLVITQRLQQKINLLQLPKLELLLRIRQELLLNPVLEEVTTEENTENIQSKVDTGDEPFEELLKEKEGGELKFEEWQELFKENNPLPYEKEENAFFEKPVVEKPTLVQHLIWQLHLSRLTIEEIKIGEIIISEINERGYLMTSIEELSSVTNIPLAEMNRVLKVIHTFDPIGVGARNLKECLLLQLSEGSDTEKLAAKIVENYLEEVKNKDCGKVAKELSIDLEKSKEAFDLICSLNPTPGNIFEDIGSNYYIIPDVIVDKVENEYVVVVNDDGLPKLRFNNYYVKLINEKEKLPKDAKEFLEKQFQSANWFLECIEQRKMTLYKVTSAIVKRQTAFFDKGIEYLNSLNLKLIAEDVGHHESTVSRAISNKYVETPRGLFELKFFFPRGFEKMGNEVVSSLTVKETIRGIIENEGTKLSDAGIAVILKEKGINIARRTVSKYRDKLKIPGVNKRKEEDRRKY